MKELFFTPEILAFTLAAYSFFFCLAALAFRQMHLLHSFLIIEAGVVSALTLLCTISVVKGEEDFEILALYALAFFAAERALFLAVIVRLLLTRRLVSIYMVKSGIISKLR